MINKLREEYTSEEEIKKAIAEYNKDKMPEENALLFLL